MPGQEEINVRYADALTMADRHALIKNAAKEIAWSKGRSLTFMAKYSHRRPPAIPATSTSRSGI